VDLTKQIETEIVALMQAVRRHNLGLAISCHERAFWITKFALHAIEDEMSKEFNQDSFESLLSMQKAYRDIESSLVEQRAAIDRLVEA